MKKLSKIHIHVADGREDLWSPSSLRQHLKIKSGLEVEDIRRSGRNLEITVGSDEDRLAVSLILRKWMVHYHYDAINIHVAESLCPCCAGQVHDIAGGRS